MSEVNIIWKDDVNAQWDGTLNISPSKGENDAQVEVSDGINDKLDRYGVMTAKAVDFDALSVERTVKQEGKRIAFCTGDNMIYYTGDEASVNVLKPKTVDVIHIDQNNSDPFTRVSGDVNGDVIKWIRQNSHRVLAKKTAEGVVAYARLDDSGSNKYHDGTDSVLTGSEGDVFVKLPAFYYYGTEGDNVDIFLSRKKESEDYIEWDENTLIGAYEAYLDGNELRSISGVESTGNTSQVDFKQYARNRGAGYQLVDWQMHCVLGCLYYAMYGNTDCQSTVGQGTNDYSKTTGWTNLLGMHDTEASTNGNSQSINFWGLENWWGNKYEWIDDYVNPAGVLTATVNDPVTGGVRNLDFAALDGYYVKKMKFGKYLDLCNSKISDEDGSDSTYYCDYQWWPGSTASGPRVMIRSNFNAFKTGGVAYIDVRNESYPDIGFSSRLAFRGTSIEAESIEQFKALPVL